MAANANMTLWDSVQKTDPSHTKKVDIGRKFTSIDAHYQILSATAAFGPVGQGWGYSVEHSTVTAGAAVLAAADVTLWVGDRANTFGPWRGMAEVLNLKGKIDDDASKKATTDAITKALSHLGFNADVFLGRFDDNKYVAQMAKEFAAPTSIAPVAGEKLLAAAGDVAAEGIDALRGFFEALNTTDKHAIKPHMEGFKAIAAKVEA